MLRKFTIKCLMKNMINLQILLERINVRNLKRIQNIVEKCWKRNKSVKKLGKKNLRQYPNCTLVIDVRCCLKTKSVKYSLLVESMGELAFISALNWISQWATQMEPLKELCTSQHKKHVAFL